MVVAQIIYQLNRCNGYCLYLLPVEGRGKGGADHGGEAVQNAAAVVCVVAEEGPHLCGQGVQAAHALRVHDLAVLEGLEPADNLFKLDTYVQIGNLSLICDQYCMRYS